MALSFKEIIFLNPLSPMLLLRRSHLWITGLFVSVLLAACKKNDPEATCRISGVNENESSGYHIAYNNNGTIQSIIHNIGFVNSFSYLNNRIIIQTRDSADSLYETDESVLNDRGMLDSTFRKDGNGILYLINTFQYRSDGSWGEAVSHQVSERVPDAAGAANREDIKVKHKKVTNKGLSCNININKRTGFIQ